MINRYDLKTKYICLFLSVVITISLTGCKEKAITSGEYEDVSYEVTESEDAPNLRDNTPEVLIPVCDGKITDGCDDFVIDYGNASEGYFIVHYLGSNEKVKMQLTGPDGVTYTYNLGNSEAVIPITSGNGSYNIVAFENIGGNQYSTLYATDLDFNVVNEFGPYLYPNQYVNFTKDSAIVPLAKDLAKSATSDLEVVTAVYSYIVSNIEYDEVKLQNAEKTYLPDVDEVLSSKKGFCFDYAALMAAMLRSQRIPARMEIGYAGDAYHAWLSVNIDDKGWVSGIIEFDGATWTLMDPTFAANSSKSSLKSFIGDGSNYITKYVY